MVAKREEGKLQSLKEEIANSITHGIGIILSVIGLSVLIYTSIRRGSPLCIVSCSIYGSSLVVLYCMSTLYHACSQPRIKKIMQKLDHMSIYFLIVGSYMPITLLAVKGAFGWVIFGIECGLCLLGFLFKIFFGSRFAIVSVLFYLLMGWIAVLVIKPLFIALPLKGFIWIFIGGLFYTLGVVFFAVDRKFSYFHAIWHLFVLGGSISHFVVVLLYIIPCG